MQLPYAKIEFTTKGAVAEDKQKAAALDLVRRSQATDVLVIAHGWNNDMGAAERWYGELCDNVARQRTDRRTPGKLAVIGVLWPSIKWADDDDVAGGGLAVGDPLDLLLTRIAEAVEDPDVAASLRAHADGLESSDEARRGFVAALRKQLPSARAVDDDDPIPDTLKSGDVDELFAAVQDAELGAHDTAPVSGAVGDLPPGIAPDLLAGDGQAAGFSLGGLSPMVLARSVLNATTYYTMKDRAGRVGTKGVAGLLKEISTLPDAPRVHLVGHSFGARVVTSAAASSKVEISSVTLLQGAFSHLAFSADDGPLGHAGAFRKAIHGGHVTGPIVVTHTHNDKAVGLAYAIASRIARQAGQGIGDAGDPYGGVGANGAVGTDEADDSVRLGDADTRYSFKPGTIHNLRADRFISNHSDIRGVEVANALAQAITATT